MNNVIEINNLSKRYLISHLQKNKASSLRDLIGRTFSKKEIITDLDPDEQNSSVEDFWALKDVSFEVKEGERIAVIGGNGAGKSTLLKILSRITEPTEGTVKIKGKVASLLEVGTGFHPELSGRENIYLNGAILGMSRREIQSKFDTIVQFSGVENFLDTPVKHYSSGMYVRLAFSVSAWLDPDILIVDEVLSVGDQAFQKRCAERMKELTGDGKTVIFVSHSMAAVKTMCEKALYLKNGQVVSFSPVEDAAKEYVRSVLEESESGPWHCSHFNYVRGVTENYKENLQYAECIEGWIENCNGIESAKVALDQPFKIFLKYCIKQDLPFSVVPNFHFYTEDGARLMMTLPEKTASQTSGEYIACCEIPKFLINNGRYTVMPALTSYAIEQPIHFAIENALRFEIFENPNTDDRRHGWTGEIPGVSRSRLDWSIIKC